MRQSFSLSLREKAGVRGKETQIDFERLIQPKIAHPSTLNVEC